MKTNKMKMIAMGMAVMMMASLAGCASNDTREVKEGDQTTETQGQNAKETRESLEENVSIKDVVYDASTSTITGTIVNDNDVHLNYVSLSGTVAYSGDEIESGECGINGSTPQDINFVSDSGMMQDVSDIDANSEKQFSLTIEENGNFGALQPDPSLISQPELRIVNAFSDELAQEDGGLYILPQDYEISFNYDAEQGDLTIQLSNNSDQDWIDSTVWVRYAYDGEEGSVAEINCGEVAQGDTVEISATRMYRSSDFSVKCLYARVDA